MSYIVIIILQVIVALIGINLNRRFLASKEYIKVGITTFLSLVLGGPIAAIVAIGVPLLGTNMPKVDINENIKKLRR